MRRLVCGLWILGWLSSPVSAELITFDYSGTTSRTHSAFSATMTFDTALGNLTVIDGVSTLYGADVIGQPRANPVFAASITVPEGTFNFTSPMFGWGEFVWSGSIVLSASAVIDPWHTLRLTDFQWGVCPPGPCGGLDTTFISALPAPVHTPGPVVGAGLPGLMVLGGLLAWRRMRFRGGV